MNLSVLGLETMSTEEMESVRGGWQYIWYDYEDHAPATLK